MMVSSEDRNPQSVIKDWRSYTFPVNLAIDMRVRGLCAAPYPGHKKGCPKFNSGHPTCPPDAPKIFEFFNVDADFFVVMNEFNIGEHMRKLAIAHPNWSERQLMCCLYWQPTARKQLAQKISYVLARDDFKGFISTTCPEAMGVNITETMRRAGVNLEWPPTRIARQIALLGTPAREREIGSSGQVKPTARQNELAFSLPRS